MYLNESDVAALCEVPELVRMTHLDVGWTTATDAGARRLAACPYLDRIELLNYAGDNPDSLSESGREVLRERFGDRVVLDVESYYGSPAGWAYRRRVVTGRRL